MNTRRDQASGDRVSIFEGELHEVATKRANLKDFGDADYRAGLRALLEALDAEKPLTQACWVEMQQYLAGVLIGRLYAYKGWADHPAVLSLPICRPLFIVGLPRSGTTALHRLLCVDQKFQGPELWLAQRPMVRPERIDWSSRVEYREISEATAQFRPKLSTSRTAHEFAAHEVDECFFMLMQTFFSHNWGPSVPGYARWLESQDLTPSYHYYANVLRLIGAREPERTWLLKYPLHMMEIQSLLAVFPDAGIIQIHRDPVESIPSWYNLYKNLGYDESSGRTNILARGLLHYARQSLIRMDEVRAKCPDRFFDVDFLAFKSDPMRVVAMIYERFGLVSGAGATQRMRRRVMHQLRDRREGHKPNLHGFDVTADEIATMFSDYRAQHAFGDHRCTPARS